MLARLFAAAIAALLLSGPAIAATTDLSGPWVVRPSSVVCERYFAVRDAEAAQAAHDARWFSTLPCAAPDTAWPVLAIIDSRPNDPVDIWRVRIGSPRGDITAYVRGMNVVKKMPDGSWKTYPCAHGGDWRCD